MNSDTYEKLRREAQELREMPLQTPMAKMFAEALATDLENKAKTEKRKKRDLRFVVENIVSCLENWYDEFNRERTLNNLKDWLKTRKA